MDVTIQKVSALGRRLKLDIPRADLNVKIDQQMRSLAKSTFVPGFRKGKVPKAVLQRKYGARIRIDAMTSLVNEHIYPLLKEIGIAPATQPFITEISADATECFLYFEVNPEVIETELIGQKTIRPKVRVTPEAIDDEIGALKTQYQKWQIAERPAERGDRIFARVALSELIGEKSIAMDDTGDDALAIHLTAEQTPKEVVEACIGQSVGNVVTVKSATPNLFRPDERPQLNPDLPKQTFVFEITVLKIEKLLEDQYLDQLYDGLGIKSVHDEDFRDKVRSRLKMQILHSIYRSLVGQIKALLMFVNDFEPSEYMIVYNMIKTLQSYKLDGKDIEKTFLNPINFEFLVNLRQETTGNVKWAMIEHHLIQRISDDRKDQFQMLPYSNVWAMPMIDEETAFSAEDDSLIVCYDSSAKGLVNYLISKSECQEIEMSPKEFNQWVRDYHPENGGHPELEHHHHHHEREHHDGEHSEHEAHEIALNTSVGSSSAEQADNLVPDEAQMRSAVYSHLGITVGKISS